MTTKRQQNNETQFVSLMHRVESNKQSTLWNLPAVIRPNN